MTGELSVKTYGMEEAISAMARATNATKQQGINHPKTNPTWPPNNKLQDSTWRTYNKLEPLTRPNENVDATEPITPIIEMPKATVSKILYMEELSISESECLMHLAHRKLASKLASVSEFSKFFIVSTNDNRVCIG